MGMNSNISNLNSLYDTMSNLLNGFHADKVTLTAWKNNRCLTVDLEKEPDFNDLDFSDILASAKGKEGGADEKTGIDADPNIGGSDFKYL